MKYKISVVLNDNTGPNGWETNVNVIGTRRVSLGKRPLPSDLGTPDLKPTHYTAMSMEPFVLVARTNGREPRLAVHVSWDTETFRHARYTDLGTEMEI